MIKNKFNINLVAGCGHTGSTIISRILGEHSKIFFPKKETNVFLLYNDFDQKKLINILNKECLKSKKKQILEKTNRHIWHVDYIRKKYKGVRFILITRGAQDVIASLYKRKINKSLDSLISCIARYQDDSIWTIRQKGNKDTIIVKYEDFILNPKKVLTKIFKFMNLKYEDSVMNYHNNKIDWNGQTKLIKTDGLGEKNHDLLRNWQVNQRIYRKKISWNKIIPKKYHYYVDHFMKDKGNRIMKKLGYKNIDVFYKK